MVISKMELLEIDGVTAEMVDMYYKAVNEKLMIYSQNQFLWFFPNQLAEFWRQGRFRWNVIQWSLRTPKECLEDLNRQIVKKHEEIQELTVRKTTVTDYVVKK